MSCLSTLYWVHPCLLSIHVCYQCHTSVQFSTCKNVQLHFCCNQKCTSPFAKTEIESPRKTKKYPRKVSPRKNQNILPAKITKGKYLPAKILCAPQFPWGIFVGTWKCTGTIVSLRGGDTCVGSLQGETLSMWNFCFDSSSYSSAAASSAATSFSSSPSQQHSNDNENNNNKTTTWLVLL